MEQKKQSLVFCVKILIKHRIQFSKFLIEYGKNILLGKKEENYGVHANLETEACIINAAKTNIKKYIHK